MCSAPAPAAMQAGGAPAAGDAPAAAAHAQASCVYIKRAGDAPADGDVFAELLILPGDTVARLAGRACAKFAWGTPSQARLLLVDHPHDADEPPSAEQETVATELTRPHWALPRAGVRSGSWLLARVPPPPPPAVAVDVDALCSRIVSALRDSGSDAASAATPAAYEESGRKYLRDNFERHFGLRILDTACAQRAEGDIVTDDGLASSEWDFRVPVNISSSPFFHTEVPGSHIYPAHERYLRPARPARARELTPAKLPSGAATASDFMAIFEITTTRRWSPGLLSRLEQRLAVSLDRARALDPGSPHLRILDVVAVIGVIGIDACQASVATLLATRAGIPLLKEMADAARFVFILRPFTQ